MTESIMAKDWATFPWTALVWFIGVTLITFLMEWKGDMLRQREPEVFTQRRIAVLVYGFVVGVINLAQMIMWVQLIDSFNLLCTSLLFLRFWAIEKGSKRSLARNMGLLMCAFTVLSFLAAFAEAGMAP